MLAVDKTREYRYNSLSSQRTFANDYNQSIASLDFVTACDMLEFNEIALGKIKSEIGIE